MDTIIFDVDDTLYDQASSFKRTCLKMFPGIFTEQDLDKLYIVSRKYSDALFDRQVAGELTVREMHILRIQSACHEFGVGISVMEALEFQEAYVAEQQRITLFEEVEEMLTLLKARGKQLAVLTNGEEGHQSMKIRQLGLEKWIPSENIFISGAIGHAKPAEEAFRYIEEKLQLERERTVYIGDSFANDIVGAKSAGWHAVWMNHRRRTLPDQGYLPDKEVHSASELLQLFGEELSFV